MRLMDVQTDTTTVCGIERHTFRCSTCPQTAQRLMFNRPRMPIIHLPVVTRPKAPAIDLQMGRPAAGSGWVNAVEKLNSKQADLKQRTAMTVRTPGLGLGGREGQHRPQTASSLSEGRSVGEDGREAPQPTDGAQRASGPCEDR
jgi:hypothetical protein